jgi:hypothetical protein
MHVVLSFCFALLLSPSFSSGAPNKKNPPAVRAGKENAFWTYRFAEPEAGSTLLGSARLGCMALISVRRFFLLGRVPRLSSAFN